MHEFGTLSSLTMIRFDIGQTQHAQSLVVLGLTLARSNQLLGLALTRLNTPSLGCICARACQLYRFGTNQTQLLLGLANARPSNY